MKQHSTSTLIQVLHKTNGRCFYCNKNAEAVDHFYPQILFRGLSSHYWNGVENLVPSCKSCNSSKGKKLPEDFLGTWRAYSRQHRANIRIGIDCSTPDSCCGFFAIAHFHNELGSREAHRLGIEIR